MDTKHDELVTLTVAPLLQGQIKAHLPQVDVDFDLRIKFFDVMNTGGAGQLGPKDVVIALPRKFCGIDVQGLTAMGLTTHELYHGVWTDLVGWHEINSVNEGTPHYDEIQMLANVLEDARIEQQGDVYPFSRYLTHVRELVHKETSQTWKEQGPFWKWMELIRYGDASLPASVPEDLPAKYTRLAASVLEYSQVEGRVKASDLWEAAQDLWIQYNPPPPPLPPSASDDDDEEQEGDGSGEEDESDDSNEDNKDQGDGDSEPEEDSNEGDSEPESDSGSSEDSGDEDESDGSSEDENSGGDSEGDDDKEQDDNGNDSEDPGEGEDSDSGDGGLGEDGEPDNSDGSSGGQDGEGEGPGFGFGPNVEVGDKVAHGRFAGLGNDDAFRSCPVDREAILEGRRLAPRIRQGWATRATSPTTVGIGRYNSRRDLPGASIPPFQMKMPQKKQLPPRVVLIVDVSGSMLYRDTLDDNGHNALYRARVAATALYHALKSEPGSQVAMWLFSTTAKEVKTPAELTMWYEGGTHLDFLETIAKKYPAASGWEVIMVTDAEIYQAPARWNRRERARTTVIFLRPDKDDSGEQAAKLGDRVYAVDSNVRELPLIVAKAARRVVGVQKM